MNIIGVGLIDHSKSDIERIKKVLENGHKNRTILEFSSVKDFQSNWDASQTDILIIDHQFEDGTSFDVLNYLNEIGSSVPVIILSNKLQDKDVARLITDFRVNDIILKRDLHHLNQSVLKELKSIEFILELEKQKQDLKNLSLVAKHTHNGVILTGKDEKIIWVNEAYCRISGFSFEESIGKQPGSILQGKNTSAEAKVRIRQYLKDKVPFSEEILNYHKDGYEHWIKLDITPIFEDGIHTGYVAIQEDISERKKTEIDLKTSEELFRSLTENLHGVVIRYSMGDDNPGTIEYISERCLDIYEISQQEILEDNSKLWSLIDPDDVIKMGPTILESAKNLTLWSFQYRFTTPSGKQKWIRAAGTPKLDSENNQVIWDTIAVDVTKEMQYENALVAANERLNNAQKAGKIGDWYYDIKNNLITWSDETFQIYERDKELGEPDFEQIIFGYTISDAVHFHELIELAVNNGLSYEQEIRIKTEKGVKKDVLVIGIPTKNESGEIEFLFGTIQDITRRMEASRKIKESEVRLESAIRGADLGVWDLNIKTGQNIVNTRWYKMLGYEPGEIEPDFDTFVKMLHPEDINIPEDKFANIIEGNNEFDLVIRLKHKDGSYRVIRDRGRVIARDEEGFAERIIGTHLDITNETTLQQQLSTSLSEKTILLQEIHHRVKNNLAVIIGLLHLQSFKSDNKKLSIFYDEMSNRIKSIADVHELLYSSETLSKINLNIYIEKLFKNVLSLGDTDISPKSFINIADDFEMTINQAIPLGLLINELLTNSVKHAFKNISDPFISFSVLQENGAIKITYKDNGIGFEVEKHQSMNSLGFTLINTLLEQLESDFTFTNSIGFGIEFNFPLFQQDSHSFLKPIH